MRSPSRDRMEVAESAAPPGPGAPPVQVSRPRFDAMPHRRDGRRPLTPAVTACSITA